MALISHLESLFTPIVNGLGCVLWGLEFARHGHSATLRIYIDKPGGITLDDCERVSRQVSALLDVEDPIEVAYRLEVSSPGLERSFFVFEQLLPYVGQELKVRLRSRGMGRKRNFLGVLQAAAEGQLTLQEPDSDPVTFPWSEVEKASLVVRFDD